MTTIEYFDLYVEAGFKVIPLYSNSKIPVGKDWNKSWNLGWCRNYLVKRPDANLGVLLGTIVDVEGDTVEANEILDEMVRGYPHPMYQSSKSTHHFFVNPDPHLTISKFSGFEFRAYKHQSVIPPSNHADGTRYVWSGLSKFPVPPMPDALLHFYFQNRKVVQKRRKSELKPGHIRTLCPACQENVYLHRKRLSLEVRAFAEHNLQWLCHDCRSIDVREACRRIRNTPILDSMPHKNQRVRQRFAS